MDQTVKFVLYDLTTFVLKNLRQLFDKWAIARTEHGSLIKSMTKILSNFVAFSENPNFTRNFQDLMIPFKIDYRCPPIGVFGRAQKTKDWSNQMSCSLYCFLTSMVARVAKVVTIHDNLLLPRQYFLAQTTSNYALLDLGSFHKIRGLKVTYFYLPCKKISQIEKKSWFLLNYCFFINKIVKNGL